MTETEPSRPTRCPCGAPLYRATDAYVVICHACDRDFVVAVRNDYLLAEPQYAAFSDASQPSAT